jgi:glycosyltransferase, group 1 family
MKVAFYLPNALFPETDCTRVAESNPGIGGTQYLIILIATELAKRNNGIDVILYAQCKGILPQDAEIRLASTEEEAILDADKMGIDIFVDRPLLVDWKSLLPKLQSNMKIVLWCHNFLRDKMLRISAEQPRITRLVTVSKEQMDMYRDYPAFEKSDYIMNTVPYLQQDIEAAQRHPYCKRPHNVVYVGSLVDCKTFDELAAVWPRVLRKVPDAQLYVIGSGQTYNHSAQLGKYNIADEAFERKFMPYLIDDQGKILPSVHFMGNMGAEKNKIILNSKVGVPNPRGFGETFCISAVEMQLLGCSVTAMSASGYFDTFINGRVTAHNRSSLAQSIIGLLLANEPIVPLDQTIAIINERFSLSVVIEDWERFLKGDLKTHIHPIYPLANKYYRLKWLKELLRKLKLKFPFFSVISPIEACSEHWEWYEHKWMRLKEEIAKRNPFSKTANY